MEEKNKWEKYGIVHKQITHLSHLLVSQRETEQTCLTFIGALAPLARALWSAGASLLELDTRQARIQMEEER